MFGFIFRSIKMLIIWVIIGIIAAYAYGLAKPYFNKVEPVIKQSVDKVTEKVDKIKNIESVRQIVNKAVEQADYVKKELTQVNEKKAPAENKAGKVQLAKNNSNSKENDLFERQMSIVNELMNN